MVEPVQAVPSNVADVSAVRAPASPSGFSLLFVCTGNICRSPMAERLLTAWQEQRAGADADAVSVASAGTRSVVGHGLTEQAAAIVARAGGEAADHEARTVTPEMLAGADLVLVMTRDHRAAVSQLQPSVVHRCFTVREAGRIALTRGPALSGATPAQRWQALVAELAAGRGSQPTRTPRADDVIDPFRASDEVYARCAAQLLPALTALLDAVAPEQGWLTPRVEAR